MALRQNFVDGDGIGGTETPLGKTNTSEECIEMVSKQYPSANGVTYGADHGKHANECFAEFGASTVKRSPKWKTCIIEGKIYLSIYIYIYIYIYIIYNSTVHINLDFNISASVTCEISADCPEGKSCSEKPKGFCVGKLTIQTWFRPCNHN